jgi:hypothetical protein
VNRLQVLAHLALALKRFAELAMNINGIPWVHHARRSQRSRRRSTLWFFGSCGPSDWPQSDTPGVAAWLAAVERLEE